MKKILLSLVAVLCTISVNAQKVTLDLLASDWDFPTSYVNSDASYTNGTYTIKMLKGTDGSGWKLNTYNGTTTGFLFGKKGATLQLPAFDFAVSKIIVNGPESGASGKVTFNVFDGTTAVSTQATGANGSHEFTIDKASQAAGTVYSITNTNSNNNQIVSIEIYEAVTGAPDAPTFSVAAGTYTSTQTVELACATEGASIYYTLDGTDPDETSAVYTEALTISETTTVKAVAYKNSLSSTIESATYTIVSVTGEGTQEKPYTVTDVKKLNNCGATAWVSGTIVGVYNNNKPTTEVGTINTNLALATANDTIPVELPTGDIRTALNLVDNADLLGQGVKVKGNLVSYFSTTGVKGVTEYELESGKQSAGLKWSKTSISVENGTTFTAPTFSKETTATVSFSTNNEEVATVTSEGVISLAGNDGTAVITASAEANDEYTAGTAKCTIVVYHKNFYVKVTNKTIVDGNKYLMVAQRNDSTFCAYPLAQSKTFGALPVNKFGSVKDTLYVESNYDDTFTFTDDSGDYTIQDPYNRYLYQESEYTTFSLGNDALVWSCTPQDNGTFKFEMNNYVIVYGNGSYNSFGVAKESDITNGVLPYLYAYDENLTNGIQAITTTTESENEAVYNVAGQRVNNNFKGIVIKNGKKYLNK